MQTKFIKVLAIVVLNIASAMVQGLEVGAASRAVTPDLGGYLAGYGHDRKSTAVYDDVFAKAVVVKEADKALAIVVIDCIGLLYNDVKRIRTAVMKRMGNELLDPERIIVTSTHTHAGPDVAGLWGGHMFSNGRDEAYIDRLIELAAEQVVKAANSLTPAVMTVGSAKLNLSWIKNISEPDLLDRTITSIRFEDTSGHSIASLTNFPCHPTVLGPDNHQVSSDYVGGFYQSMDSHHGGVNLFLQGAIGGWVQPEQGDRTIELARHYGDQMAIVASQILAEAEIINTPKIQFANTVFEIPLDNWGFRLLMFFGVLDRELVDGNMRTETAWFSIGGVQMATHPGETSPVYSHATRKLMGNPPHSMVLGLGLDALGYFLKPDFFEHPENYPRADYLTQVSVGAEAAPKLMEALRKIIPVSDQ